MKILVVCVYIYDKIFFNSVQGYYSVFGICLIAQIVFVYDSLAQNTVYFLLNLLFFFFKKPYIAHERTMF